MDQGKGGGRRRTPFVHEPKQPVQVRQRVGVVLHNEDFEGDR